MLDMKNVEKVLACKAVDRPDRFVSDEILSYKCTGDVAKGDLFVVWNAGKLRIVKAIDIIPAWQYSQARKGLGDMDTMSYVINRVDLDKHSIAKKARSMIRDLRAAMAERRAKALDKKDMDDFVASLKDKKEQADFKEALQYIAELEADPNNILTAEAEEKEVVND